MKEKFASSVYSIAAFTVIMYLSLFVTFFSVISMLNQLSHEFVRFILCCTNGVCTLHQLKSMQYWYKVTGKHEAIKKFTGVCSIHLCCSVLNHSLWQFMDDIGLGNVAYASLNIYVTCRVNRGHYEPCLLELEGN
jgi:hypothetical protein